MCGVALKVSHKGNDLSGNLHFLNYDRVHSVVFRLEPEVSVLLVEGFYSCLLLIVYKGNDYVAVFTITISPLKIPAFIILSPLTLSAKRGLL